jgi:hypothetical protein
VPSMVVKDSLGREIKPGDVIVYPGRHSSTLFLRHAVVDEVVVKKKAEPRLVGGKWQLVEVDVARLKVHGHKGKYYWDSRSEQQPYKSTLQRPELTTIVERPGGGLEPTNVT